MVKIEKKSKKKVTQFGNKWYKDEDIDKVFKVRIPGFNEDEVEDEV